MNLKKKNVTFILYSSKTLMKNAGKFRFEQNFNLNTY